MSSAAGSRRARLARLRSHALLPGRTGPQSAHDVVRHMVAMQAQHGPAVALGIGARCPRLELRDISEARSSCQVVKTWVLRGTLHVVAAEDVAWLVGLVGPRLIERGRARMAQLGIGPAVEDRAAEVITAALADRPLPRSVLAERLRSADIDVDSNRQTTFHLLQRTALRGRICFAPDGGDVFTLLRDVAPRATGPRGDAAVTELARRYQASHAPATVQDFIAWSGLPASQARRAWSEPRQAAVPDHKAPLVSLLPQFDSYLLGYADRTLVLDSTTARRVQRGGGWLHPIVLLDGEVVGTWALDDRHGVDLDIARILPPQAHAALSEAVAEVERFLSS